MKKFGIKIIVIIFALLFALSFNVNAKDGYDTLKDGNGKTVCYRGTDKEIYIPTTYEEKATEFRGTWVSFYAGDIDGYTSKDQMQRQLLDILDTLEYYNMNAVVFHIRTHNDAYYKTDLAPLNAECQGMNFDEWDYLTWFIDECHKRGIEFHAWLNPYRIYSTNPDRDKIIAKYADYPKNPAHDINNVLIGKADDGAILDPGKPVVRDYIVDVCMDIIEHYDVDAIHFDDYFYIGNIDDSATRAKYNTKKLSIDEFRREQVNLFIEQLSNEMRAYNKAHNRSVQLGISPTGTYRNGVYVDPKDYKYDSNGNMTYPLYSGTAGYSHYDPNLYADSKKWIDNEWIDYITPQCYSPIDNLYSSHASQAIWWNGVVKNKKVNLYLGVGLYQKASATSGGWFLNEDELLYELKFDQVLEHVDGICIYQYKTFIKLKNSHCIKELKANYWTHKALNPVSQMYKNQYKDKQVDGLKLYKGDNQVDLSWNKLSGVRAYIVYKYKDTLDTNDYSQIVGIVGNDVSRSYVSISDSNYDNTFYKYSVIPVSNANTLLVQKSITTDDASTLNYPIGTIHCTATIVTRIGESVSFVLDDPEIYFGNTPTYTVLASYTSDFKEYEVLFENKEFNGTNILRFRFNDLGKKTYIKVIVTNNMGSFESDVYEYNYTDTISTLSSYISKRYNTFMDGIINDEE